MKKTIIFAISVVLFSCNQQKPDTKAEGEKILQLSRDWSTAASSGDVEKTLSYWAEDAVVISAGEQPLKGKAAIRQMVEDGFKMPGFKISWEPESVQVSEQGDMAYLLETTTMQYADSAGVVQTMINKGVTIWRKQTDGSWKNVVDISAPLPAQGN